jgi:hypothetical protein
MTDKITPKKAAKINIANIQKQTAAGHTTATIRCHTYTKREQRVLDAVIDLNSFAATLSSASNDAITLSTKTAFTKDFRTNLKLAVKFAKRAQKALHKGLDKADAEMAQQEKDKQAKADKQFKKDTKREAKLAAKELKQANDSVSH